jgi:hypothetical protein
VRSTCWKFRVFPVRKFYNLIWASDRRPLGDTAAEIDNVVVEIFG